MTLIFKGYAWYLFSFCLFRNDYRLFRLSRMKDVNVLDQKFIRKEKAYKEFLKESYQSADLVDVILKFSDKVKQKVIEYFGEEKAVIQEDGNIIVKFTYPEDDYIYSIILGFEEHVELLEPAYMRDKLKEKAEKILSRYKYDIMVSQK